MTTAACPSIPSPRPRRARARPFSMHLLPSLPFWLDISHPFGFSRNDTYISPP
jgi:hypothetical protein